MSDRWALHLGNCLDVMRDMEENSVDSIVTDPPYGLAFMGKRWDYDVPSVEIWAECLRVLKPGGHLLAFAGTRTQHRMAVRIEDGGFEIRDMIAWVYASGFPKSLDVSKAIDKAAGAEREKIRHKPRPEASGTMSGSSDTRPWIEESRKNGFHEVAGPVPVTDSARQWSGWGTALKPALEPITMARKPLEGTVASNVQEWGTGGLNIDGCRVETGEKLQGSTVRNDIRGAAFGAGHRANPGDIPPYAQNELGRWPANLIHDGSDEVVRLLDDAARFFYCAKASKSDRDGGLEGFEERQPTHGKGHERGGLQVSNSVKAKRNHHPTVKPTDLMRYLCRLITPPGGLVFDPFTGSGSTGKAAMLEGFRFIGAELSEEYAEIARARIGHAASRERQKELALS